MTIVYRDMTFCVNHSCKNKCRKFLTPKIEAAARQFGLPIACAEYICLDKGEDGVYEYKTEEIDGKEMS